MKLSQFQDCIDLLQNLETIMEVQWKEVQEGTKIEKSTKITSLLYLLRAEALESLDVRANALVWYQKALKTDVTCVEAWKRLSEGFMQSPSEESAFLASLEFPPELEWLKAIYTTNTIQFASEHNMRIQEESPTAKVARPKPMPGLGDRSSNNPSPTPFLVSSSSGEKTELSQQTTESSKPINEPVSPLPMDSALVKRLDNVYGLGDNEDVVASRAQALFYANRVREAFKLTSKLLERDPYSVRVLETHLSCLVELGLKNDLYLLAHKMAENAPKSALSWYAVGCYYFLTRSWQNARLYFGKAAAAKREFGAAWLAYGYTFAQNGEHDQALSAYRTASRLLVGSHLPTLFIAVELTRAKDMIMAAQFALKSVNMQPNDPYPWHEFGVILFRTKDYAAAIKNFQTVLSMLGKNYIDLTWEPTIFNLAQAYIKLKQYDKAIEYLEWSLTLLPHNASTYLSLAFTHHAAGHLSEAIDAYHSTLTLTPDNDFAIEALDEALNEWVLTKHLGLTDDSGSTLDE